ncbi:hypothetical protein CmeUKMEL1_04255 [Cryptosporidium meleagridis]|uniref:Uncharacterized protein n=1 Tax=Cryptosporidium meleagridis TaxID=93969 RepID=A0A2P4YYC1_9CRYT|nr:hypothetical protein CmeUKMEL1_04255 [Cryptosporidium meleagridis]
MNFRIVPLVLLYILGFIFCNETSEYFDEKKDKENDLKAKLAGFSLLKEPKFKTDFEDDEQTNDCVKQTNTFSKIEQPVPEKSEVFSIFKKLNTSKPLNKENNQQVGKQHKFLKIVKPTLNLQQRQFKVFSSNNKKTSSIDNQKKYNSKAINSNQNDEAFNFMSSTSNLREDQGIQVTDEPGTLDIRLEILENKDFIEREKNRIANENVFMKEKTTEKIKEQEFSIIEPEENQIEVWDDTQIYKMIEPGEERILKYPFEIGKPRKIAIRSHPELKKYRQSDIDLSKMKSRQLKHDQELEFIETSQEAQHMFETAGSPFRNVRKGVNDPLNDENMAVLDMPLGYTPDGIRDIVEEYFWGDFPIFDYEHDRVNPPDSLAHFFELDSNIKNIRNILPLHHSDILEPELKDLISLNSGPKKDVKVLISERRDLLTVKDRPFSLTRSISKGFKNIFLRRKSKKAKQKFLSDLKNAIIEWSSEYDSEFPMITFSPNKYISPKAIKEALNSNENENINLDLKQRLEFIGEMLKKEDAPLPENSQLFNINLSRQLFPELKFEDIPDIKGVPVEELIILSSSGILPNMGDFEHTLNSIRNELIEAERIKGSFEDPLDSRLLKRHVLIKELPPISANDDELVEWEMKQREKMFREEYDEHDRRKFKLQLLPLDRSLDAPNLKLKSPDRKIGKVEVSDEEVQKLRNYEKSLYPEFIKRTDKLAKEAEIKRIAYAIDKRDQVEADLKRTPTAFKRKILSGSPNFISEDEMNNPKKDSRTKKLLRPHTTAMTHLNKNFREAIIDSSKFNYGSNSGFGGNVNDYIEEDYLQ